MISHPNRPTNVRFAESMLVANFVDAADGTQIMFGSTKTILPRPAFLPEKYYKCHIFLVSGAFFVPY
ncbi:MAG: hypothetical protein LBQ94_07665 [Treponema sp.]|jgi:hypothetical protein|nr:hypothetical protein [Treponema sp.]